MTEVLFLVAFYGIRCTRNLDILRRVCKTLRDRIDRDILREVIAVNHIRTLHYNRFHSSRGFFPHQNVLDSMKPEDQYHVLRYEAENMNWIDPKFLWNTTFVEPVDGSLLISFNIDYSGWGSTINPKFDMYHKQIPEDSTEPREIMLFARKKAKIN